MKIRLLLSIAIFFLFFSVFAQEVSQWRGPDRNGVYPETSLLKTWPAQGPKLLWHFDELGEGFASAVVTREHIYTSGTINGKGYVFCLTPAGKLEWKMTYGDEWTESWNGARSTPLFYDGKVYMLSPYGKLVCFGALRGNIIWSVDIAATYGAQNITWGITENLLIDDNKLFCTVGGPKHNVVALDKDTGKLIWSCAGNGEKSAYSSPLLIKLKDRELLVTVTEKSILGIDAETGNKLWRQEIVNQYAVHPNTPIYENGFLYVVTGYGTGGFMYKLSADGSQISRTWANSTLDPKTGGALLLNGRIYGFGDRNKGFHIVDWKSGQTVATEKLNQKGGIAIAADGIIYAYDEAGEVFLLQPTSSGITKVCSFKVPYGAAQHWAYPVIKDGKLYIRHGNSLMVYDIKNP